MAEVAEKVGAEKVPNPGSPEARELSCICPVFDNNYGEGFMMAGERVWWRAGGCPLHDPALDELEPTG